MTAAKDMRKTARAYAVVCAGCFFCGEVTAVEHPVCLEGQRAGTLYVYPGARETELRAVCRGTERGLYRLYVQGERGEVLLGVTEDGCLHRRFSRELLEPAEQECMPSLVLRRLLPGETLWDVAKQYRTDETLLRTVNQLEGEELPDKMLLIPRVR